MNKKLTFERIALDTPFRGNRNYIHSTSIYNQLQVHINEFVGKNAWIRQLKLNQFFDTQCYATTNLDENDQQVGNFSVQIIDSIIQGFIVADPSIAISSREEFDEGYICSKATMLDEGVENEWQVKVPFIDQCVSLTKYFHNELYPLESKKWIYTRLTMQEDTTHLNPKKITIKLNRKLGNRITQSSIFFDEEKCGVIEFSVN